MGVADLHTNWPMVYSSYRWGWQPVRLKSAFHMKRSETKVGQAHDFTASKWL